MKCLRKALDDEKEKRRNHSEAFIEVHSSRGSDVRRRVDISIRDGIKASNEVNRLKKVLKNIKSQYGIEKARVAKIQE